MFDFDLLAKDARGHIRIRLPHDVSVKVDAVGYCVWVDDPPFFIDLNDSVIWKECRIVDAHFVAPADCDEVFYYFVIKTVQPQTRFFRLAERFL